MGGGDAVVKLINESLTEGNTDACHHAVNKVFVCMCILRLFTSGYSKPTVQKFP
jgi:hypothetical protein